MKLEKIQIKYGWKVLDMRNNYAYRNFLRFLIARKNTFIANEDRKFEFNLKMKFGLISQ
jgi:hypothetical protein